MREHGGVETDEEILDQDGGQDDATASNFIDLDGDSAHQFGDDLLSEDSGVVI